VLDQERLRSNVYGVKGSDGRSSFWTLHVFSDVDIHPTGHQFYAWASHDGVVYRHGGIEFVKAKPTPEMEQLWCFDATKRQWTFQKTTGQTPGPRSSHTAVTYKGALYVLGGMGARGPADMRIHKLNLETFAWSIVKSKGMKPYMRQEFSSCVYKNELYIHGGQSFTDYGSLQRFVGIQFCVW